MRSLLIWVGVLVGSVALGVGIYTAVVAPTSTGLTVSGTTASAPEPRPTVLRYKTKVVKDPPRKKVVDVPVQVASDTGSEGSSGTSRAWSDDQGSDDSGSSGSSSSGRSDDSGGSDDSGSGGGGSDHSGGSEDSYSGDDSSGGGDDYESSDDSQDYANESSERESDDSSHGDDHEESDHESDD